jgi:hypothetical protein
MADGCVKHVARNKLGAGPRTPPEPELRWPNARSKGAALCMRERVWASVLSSSECAASQEAGYELSRWAHHEDAKRMPRWICEHVQKFVRVFRAIVEKCCPERQRPIALRRQFHLIRHAEI